MTSQYDRLAPLYDLVSLEWPVYRAGRVAAIDALGLAPGMRVLDLGCGTGLNHPLLQERVGPQGAVVGIDLSAHMLARARRRADRRRWGNVELIQADMTTIGERIAVDTPFDAVIATYSLSLVPDWRQAWSGAVTVTRPGGRLAVVDMQLPVGAMAPCAPLARMACALGGSDIQAHPWTALERDCRDITSVSVRGGHIQVRVGSR